MLSKKVKFWSKIAISTTLAIGVVTLPIISTINYSRNPTQFNTNSIGIYSETSWLPAFQLAVEKYNDLPGEQTPIQILETSSVFGAFELVDTLGYRDQVIADLIYLPLDRIPKFAERDKAILYFDSPDSLFEGLDPAIWDNDSEKKQNLADKGLAVVTKEDGTQTSGYFGMMHNVEGLVMFSKGIFQDRETYPTLQSIIDATDWSSTDTMYGMKFSDLWFAIGIIASFMDTTSGAAVGNSLVAIDHNYEPGKNQKYYSAMTSIQPLTQQKFYTDQAAILELPELAIASESLDKAIDFLFQISDKAANSTVGDWHVYDFGRWYEKLSAAKNAAFVGGSWDASRIRELSEGPGNERAVTVSPVLNPTISSGKYAQGPGGWLYAINQRNYGNEKRISDMKKFVNILLTDEDVILEQYFRKNKVVAGTVAEEFLKTNKDFSEFDKSLIQGILDSINTTSLDFRPDMGIQEFNQVWGAWDGDGWSSVHLTNVYKENISDEAKIAKIKGFLQISFRNLLTRLSASQS